MAGRAVALEHDGAAPGRDGRTRTPCGGDRSALRPWRRGCSPRRGRRSAGPRRGCPRRGVRTGPRSAAAAPPAPGPPPPPAARPRPPAARGESSRSATAGSASPPAAPEQLAAPRATGSSRGARSLPRAGDPGWRGRASWARTPIARRASRSTRSPRSRRAWCWDRTRTGQRPQLLPVGLEPEPPHQLDQQRGVLAARVRGQAPQELTGPGPRLVARGGWTPPGPPQPGQRQRRRHMRVVLPAGAEPLDEPSFRVVVAEAGDLADVAVHQEERVLIAADVPEQEPGRFGGGHRGGDTGQVAGVTPVTDRRRQPVAGACRAELFPQRHPDRMRQLRRPRDRSSSGGGRAAGGSATGSGC